jgi:Trypsin-co-occurring domain 1
LPALVQIETSSGQVLFEGDASEVVLQEMAVGDKVRDVITSTGAKVVEVGTTIRACTRDLLTVFDDLASDQSPAGSFSSAVIELGVKVTAEGNVVVAKGSVEANLKVTLNWNFG